MDICGRCGVVAPRAGLPCEACSATDRGHAAEPAPGLYFVQLTCQFQCRGCGRLAPLDGVDLSGVARCALCGLTQAFPPDNWADILAFAHGVGDLAGGEGLHPDPRWALRKANPYRELGRQRACEHTQFEGNVRADGLSVRRSLRVQGAPGHPCCEGCRAPLQVTIPDEGRVRTHCPGCAADARYDVSLGVLSRCRGLRGVLAAPHRADVPDARTQSDEGLVALSCPSCGAPLRAPDGARIVECAFCHLVCRLPAPDEAVADAPPTPFWLAFRGPSAQRADLLDTEGGPKALTTATLATVTGMRAWLDRIPAVLLAGGALAASGLALFVLMRAGLVVIPSL